MTIIWSLPTRGKKLRLARGDHIRASHLIHALEEDGHEVIVVEDTMGAGMALPISLYRGIVSKLLPRHISLILRDAGRWLHSRAHGRILAQEAKRHNADVIMETQVSFACSGSIAARLTGLPLILDDCSPSFEDRFIGIGLPNLAHRVLTKQTHMASVVIASSEALRTTLINSDVLPEKLFVVPNGVDLNAYNSVDRESVRRHLGISNKFVIGYVGSFQPWHSVELLVKAFSQLVNEYPIQLILIGDGQCMDSSIKIARSLGVDKQITFLGSVDHSKVPELISSFDIGVLPGSNEYGHPMKLLEYAAAGIASVAPDLLPVREVIKDGYTGILFSPGEVNSLTNALKRLINDGELRKRLAVQARKEIASNASWLDRSREIISIIQNLH